MGDCDCDCGVMQCSIRGRKEYLALGKIENLILRDAKYRKYSKGRE